MVTTLPKTQIVLMSMEEKIEAKHMAEAFSYRVAYHKYFSS